MDFTPCLIRLSPSPKVADVWPKREQRVTDRILR